MISFVMLSLLGAGAMALPGEPVFRQEPAFEYAYVDHQGSYETIPQAVSDFMAEFFKQGLTPTSPLLGIYLNNPAETKAQDLKWRLGLGVDPGTEVSSPLKKSVFEEQEVIFILRKGPYDTVGECYELLHKTISEKGYQINGPAFERYLSDPSSTAPQEILTEIFIPVRKG